MTMQMREAKSGQITPEMKFVAEQEKVTAEFIRKGVAKGQIVILKNNKRNIKPLGIGKGLFIKVNSNIGSSQKNCDVAKEIEKAKISMKYGADTIMDLSSGPTESDIISIRQKILDSIDVPLGTVPIYQAAMRAIERDGGIIKMTEDDMFNVVEEQAREGVDFFTIHTGVTLDLAKHIAKNPRFMGIVSRGGTLMAVWSLHHNKENPYFKNYDYLLEMAQDYDFNLSLGDGFRPGCIFDSTDYPQIQELLTISKLVKRAHKKNVQVICEGPGHIPAHQIEENIKMQKSVTNGAPFYVLGPLVTDVAPGYDHIVAAIGGTMAGLAGADYLCYVTPAEHLGLPNVEEVKQGVIASKIAAHSIDIVNRGADALDWDLKMDTARKDLDWDTQMKIGIDPEKAKRIRARDGPIERKEPCTMCGRLCAIKLLKDSMAEQKKKQNKQKKELN
ncbi:MAG: phosphomethylpyrimidine synthase ThiC [Candidatus Lokiarchaeota archaeon]|nr:phosphomethylpyrimidine synthase ThiC [Candidatus Lokiarchaeota archaeon]